MALTSTFVSAIKLMFFGAYPLMSCLFSSKNAPSMFLMRMWVFLVSNRMWLP
ncbi:hypothetical protein D3C74_492170 [compost metagenome]